MKKQRIFPNGRTIAEQYAYEAILIAESSMEILREMERLDPHLLDDYKVKIESKRAHLQVQFLRDIKLSNTDSADMATSLENLDPELID